MKWLSHAIPGKKIMFEIKFTYHCGSITSSFYRTIIHSSAILGKAMNAPNQFRSQRNGSSFCQIMAECVAYDIVM